MAIVVDASVLLAIGLGEPAGHDIEHEMVERLRASEAFHSPSLVVYEFASVIAKAARASRADVGVQEAALNTFEEIPLQLHSMSHAVREAVELSERFGKRNAYDMFYLLLARELGAELWTQDSGLRSQAEELGVPAVSFPSR